MGFGFLTLFGDNKMTTTIKLTGGVLGPMEMKVRCNLSRAESPVQVDYCEGGGWQGTQYQCADARHRNEELAEIGQKLACEAVQEAYADETRCEWEIWPDDAKLTVRCKPFRHEGVRQHKLLVEGDGTVLVWDDVADHFTSCHSLGESAIKRIRKLARS